MSNRSPHVSPSLTFRASRSTPATDPKRAAQCIEAVREIAEDLVLLADSFMTDSAGQKTSTTELLRKAADLRSLTDESIKALVVAHRSEGKPLDEIAPVLSLSEDRLRKKYIPDQAAQELATRRRPPHPLPVLLSSEDPPDPRNLMRHPRHRLAAGLHQTYIRSSSVSSQRALAERMGIDPSYVSRMFSGERDTSWRYVKSICEACEGDLELMQSLWDAAATGKPRPTDNPVRDLQTYLKALRYAAGLPDEKTILTSTRQALTSTDLHQAFEGASVPAWPVIRQLTVALQSLPQITLPLWRRAHSSLGNCSVSASAFG
ncbi:helix-turn-helix domain-containing protein [Streptomyces sp. NPDC018711]|uniref:helix-turn-helix domain-containing protein n=1 Tax=Streptomyces sp. NPDC018711 TaxID=3365052 RepID=UPI0037B8A7E4